MALTKDQILTEAMALEPSEREALAEQLLLSLTEDQQSEIDTAWVAEVRQREDAFARGQMSTSSVDEVVARIQARPRP